MRIDPTSSSTSSSDASRRPNRSRDIERLLVARGLRAFADGFVGLLLPVYLLGIGFTPLEVGVLVTATLLGSGGLTLVVGMRAHRFHSRTLLLAATALMAATGLGFAFVSQFWPLMLVALVGTMNPSGGDVTLFLPLEHALLSRVASDEQRTATFARYSLVGSLVAAVGSLAAGIPDALSARFGVDAMDAIRAMFLLYALIAGLAAIVYRGLPESLAAAPQDAPTPLRESKRRVYTLAALFSLDAFGGGFVGQSMLALWLYQRFSLSPAETGTLFFWTGLLTAASYLVAVRIANRIGLVNTMVFTHLPSSLCLLLIPFVPDLTLVIALLCLRSALSQMDVPTRSSYVMAIVQPAERSAAASVTSVPRSLASSLSPFLSGWLLGLSSFGWPLVLAGGAKIVYDLLLLAMFRHVRPPEEVRRAAVPVSGPSAGR